MKYVLSNGKTTKDLSAYIVDLFRIYMTVYKEDIPGSNIGFDFILSDVKKDELVKVINEKSTALVGIISDRVKAISGTTIRLESIERVEVDRFLLVIAASYNGSGDSEILNVNIDL